MRGAPTRNALSELEADYVETFDTRRRHNLFLTYFAHGDTRKRGMALLRFKQTYLASGFELTDTELPDHLCVVLEYAATVDPSRVASCSSTTAPGSSCCGSRSPRPDRAGRARSRRSPPRCRHSGATSGRPSAASRPRVRPRRRSA